MEGNTGTASITVEEVWREMPDQASGPHWAVVIQEAIDRYRGWRGYNDGATVEQARDSELISEYADGWPSVYTADVWEWFQKLDLWAVDAVEDRIEELEGFTAGKNINEVAAIYCATAAILTMEAVLRVAEKHEQGGYLCDRCRDRFPFDAIHYVFLRGFGSVCTDCYEALRSEDVAT